jgi:sulfofructose kinase
MARVFLTGLAVVDFVFMVEAMPIRAEKYRAETAAIVGGGCAANAAVTIARLGGRATLASRLGDDLVGDLIIADLEKEGVRTDFIHRAKGGRSAFSSVYVDPAAERQVMNFRGEQLTQETHWLERAPGGRDAGGYTLAGGRGNSSANGPTKRRSGRGGCRRPG